MRIIPLVAVAFALTGSFVGISNAQTAPVAGAMRPNDGYILGINDEIEVTIFGPGQNQTVRSRIKEDGTITVPLVGAVEAANLTPRQLSALISGELSVRGMLNDPIVNVEGVQFVSNSVTVFGEVGAPGIYPLDRKLTVGMLLARSGGAKASGADFVILRREGAEQRILTSTANGMWSTSTVVKAGDELYVPAAPSVYVYGQVGGPGVFGVKSNTTVLQALVRAGGPTLAGSQKNITLLRDGKKIKKVDLATEVRDGDVLYIHERLF